MDRSDRIHGVTFAPFAAAETIFTDQAKNSLITAKKRLNINSVIFVPPGLQETPQSEEIEYGVNGLMRDDELRSMIDFAHEQDLRVFLKPTVNCKNGTWRAHISFFDEDVPCEPKWGNWFHSYADFQCHYAGIAEDEGCEMFIAGCEMVMSEHREKEWRETIGSIRREYKGSVSYNTDKYQEHNVKWWDAVDVISSSGYYPINDWETQLDRIEKVVKAYDKPFFFAETGCMSVRGSEEIPNDWNLKGKTDPEAQAQWYEAMFSATVRRPWVMGTVIWSWGADINEDTKNGPDYEIYGKSAEKIIAEYYAK
ncbi:MAG: 1,4-beta-xylanase [Lachnospiraceae bacterium]|nr:1,4-beta-xylanase [Lachnospiraceae bacterium]